MKRVAALLCLLLPSAAAIANRALDALAERLASASTVAHVTPAYVAEGRSKRVIYLFDVRTPEEFAVSHLPGAVRLDPGMAPEAFLARYGDRLEQGEVVFYCSVGRRATRLAESVAARQRARGASALPENLRGGIFAWHNERRPLVRDGTRTDEIHPASWLWRHLLDRPERARYRVAETRNQPSAASNASSAR